MGHLTPDPTQALGYPRSSVPTNGDSPAESSLVTPKAPRTPRKESTPLLHPHLGPHRSISAEPQTPRTPAEYHGLGIFGECPGTPNIDQGPEVKSETAATSTFMKRSGGREDCGGDGELGKKLRSKGDQNLARSQDLSYSLATPQTAFLCSPTHQTATGRDEVEKREALYHNDSTVGVKTVPGFLEPIQTASIPPAAPSPPPPKSNESARLPMPGAWIDESPATVSRKPEILVTRPTPSENDGAGQRYTYNFVPFGSPVQVESPQAESPGSAGLWVYQWGRIDDDDPAKAAMYKIRYHEDLTAKKLRCLNLELDTSVSFKVSIAEADEDGQIARRGTCTVERDNVTVKWDDDATHPVNHSSPRPRPRSPLFPFPPINSGTFRVSVEYLDDALKSIGKHERSVRVSDTGVSRLWIVLYAMAVLCGALVIVARLWIWG